MTWFRCNRLAVALLAFASVAAGQQPPSPKNEKVTPAASPSDDFSKRGFEALLRERDSLTSEIDGLTNDIPWINDAIAKRNDLRRAEASHKPTDEIQKGIDQSLEYAHIAGTAPGDFDKQLDYKQNAATNKRERKTLIDAELIRRADVVGPQQSFKLEMSIIFAILVGVVIFGFFVVAFRDEQVRREIFSGQSGIQFVTLFSLVIAIILFGIIDILEGKELAALLGGLSGYILGRSMPTAGERGQRGAPPSP